MALVLQISLQSPLADAYAAYLKAGAGKALAREVDRLDRAAPRCNISPLTSLLSENPAVLIAQLKEEGFDPSRMNIPAEKWFPAAIGIKTVTALIDHVTAHLNDFKQPNPILRDLKSAHTLLCAAEAAGVDFHLTKSNV